MKFVILLWASDMRQHNKTPEEHPSAQCRQTSHQETRFPRIGLGRLGSN